MTRQLAVAFLAATFTSALVLPRHSSGATAQRPAPEVQAPVQLALGKPESRYRSVAEVLARHEYEEEHELRFPKLVRGNPVSKDIALTFDDGPHPVYTRELLAILKRENVRATFFVVGKMVDLYPQLAQQEVAEGHELANHTYDHLRLPTLQPAQIESELTNGAQAIARAVGSPTRLYRPPGGEYDDDVIAATRRLGYVMVLWTDDPADFAMPGAKTVEERVLRSVSGGGIILLHDGIQQTLDILPNLIHRLKKQGYRFVTCSEMARERGIITRGGPQILPPGDRERK